MTQTTRKTVYEFSLADRQDGESLSRFFGEQGFAVETLTSHTFHDTYLDCEHWWLYQAGVACRLRRVGDKITIALVPLASGLKLPDEETPEEELCELPVAFPGAVPGTLIPAHLVSCVPDMQVDRRAQIDVKEDLLRLRRDPDVELAATVTTGRLDTGGDLHDFIDLQLKVVQGKPKLLKALLDALATTLKMQPACGSFLQRRLEGAGMELPALVEGDELRVRPKDRFVDATYRVLRRHFGRVRFNQPGSCLGVDPEYLHDMRVATRRLRAALALFAEALPVTRVRSLRRDLKWLGSVLGAVRDLDVQLLQFAQEIDEAPKELGPALELYREQLQRRRSRARGILVKTLGSRRCTAFFDRFERFLALGVPARPKAPRAGQQVIPVAQQLISARLEKVLHDGRGLDASSTDVQLHKLRIDCKRLRYACEFFSELYPKSARKFVRRVIEIQDVLGVHQDSVVARHSLTQSFSLPRAHRRAFLLATGYLIARETQRAEFSRATFFKLWKAFDHKSVCKALLIPEISGDKGS